MSGLFTVKPCLHTGTSANILIRNIVTNMIAAIKTNTDL